MEILWNVELMYLLTFRAWCDINKVMRTFNYKKIQEEGNTKMNKRNKRAAVVQKIQFQFNSDDVNLKYLVQPMIKLFNKVDQSFIKYHKMLTLKQHYFKNQLMNIFNYIFHYHEKQVHDKYMCGFEGIDFNRKQQIKYMHSQYLTQCIQYLQNEQ